MRVILYMLAVFQAANGLLMLFMPARWYALVPGAAETGALNQHFVSDIGLAFLAAAASLALSAYASVDIGRLWPGAIFLGGHALLHIVEMVWHGTTITIFLRDFVLIIIPEMIPFALILTKSFVRKEATQ